MPSEAEVTDTVWCEVANNTVVTYTVEHLIHQHAGSRDHSGGWQLPHTGDAQLLKLGYPSCKEDGLDCLICGDDP